MTLTSTSHFDISKFKGAAIQQQRLGRLDRQYERIEREGRSADKIRSAVAAALKNVQSDGANSFVIYGEPQSGKTEMMICLTAAILDAGFRIVIVLTNDSVQLLEQNLLRFQESGLDPAPKNFGEVLDDSVVIGSREWVIFCKKNQRDLDKLRQKLEKFPHKVVIDDEADYATPNSKVNKAEQTRINELVGQLIEPDGLYMGVTATPARLDLNATFENDNTKWVDFLPHDFYTGQDIFFPTSEEELAQLKYKLVLMPAQRDDAAQLRDAVFSFLCNVAYLHVSESRPQNYSMLIHTSGQKADHTIDSGIVTGLLGVLADSDHKKFEPYVRKIHAIAFQRFGQAHADEVTAFVLARINQNNVVVMNSNADRQQATYRKATSPATLFTFAVGGNIVSRGVTFDNLLSMFFTRDSNHQLQQDTYIQRARMFGSRGEYLAWFELYIPSTLYFDWQRCFVFHKLSLKGLFPDEGVGPGAAMAG